MNRLLILSALCAAAVGLLIYAAASTRSARAEPEPCALPTVEMPAEIELHDGMSATEATLESVYGANLDGAPSHE